MSQTGISGDRLAGVKTAYCILRDTVLEFVAQHPDPIVGKFKKSVGNWGQAWCEVTPRHLPAADFLAASLSATAPR